MIIMETKVKIRRMHRVDGKSIKQIVRETHLSRNTVRKYLRQESSEIPTYHQEQVSKPMLGAYEVTLTEWLEKDTKLPKRFRRTATRLFSDLQTEGYQGAYDSIQRFVKQWKKKPAFKEAYVPLSFAIGDAY